MPEFITEIDNAVDIKAPLAEDYQAFDVEVQYSISKYDPGVWSYSNGDPGYPPSGGEVEDMRVYDMEGKDITDTLPARWWPLLLEQCIKDSEKHEED